MNTKKEKIVKEKLPTAKELFDKMLSKNVEVTSTEMMIAFAKMHVKEALKQASEKYKMKISDNVHELDMNDDWMEVDKNSILTAYSLDDIV